MDKKKIKEKLHQYIDNLEDEAALQMLLESAVEYGKADKKNIQEESIKQVDEGKTVSHEEAVKRIAEWAFKLE